VREVYHFILHLRLHYQFFLLSGGYLLGGLMSGVMDASQFWMQFLNVHVFLFGGATAYNSYWDKDEGPIGGLKNPPKMTRWMHSVSLLFMYVGWIWAYQTGTVYFLIYGFSLLLFWLYSTPHARWKGNPHLSLLAIGLSTGLNSVLLGALASGGALTFILILSALGASLVLLSLYPVSQIYQFEEDSKRGDNTFARHYGIKSVKKFFLYTYFTGLLLLSAGLYTDLPYPALILFIIGSTSGVIIYRIIVSLTGSADEYRIVMRTKLFASLSFVLFLLAANSVRYEWIGNSIFKTFF
jgi:4-hydroxybenzoate polyprenyltransferase